MPQGCGGCGSGRSVCQCGSAVLGRKKFNLFSALKLADCLRTVLGQPVHKASGVSSTICYKCKRELEKYEKYIQVLEVELKQIRELSDSGLWSSLRFDALTSLSHMADFFNSKTSKDLVLFIG